MPSRKKIAEATDFDRAKAGFLYNPDKKGRYHHFRNIVEMVWRDSPIEWNPWLEDQIKSLCDDTVLTKIGETTVRTVAWTGPGSAGKTYSSGLYAMTWFLCYPEKSSVALTSTSKMAMGGRIWAVIKDLFISAFHPDTGEPFDWHIINSRKELQWPRGDEKHGISCFAVEEGELLKSIDKIKGRHTERMLLIVDEANSTPDAIYNTIPNQLKGCKEHVTLTIGNAVSFFDNHGRACEPQDGWNSVTVDSSTWNTKGVQQWRLAPGLCKHYDGSKSPNALAGRTIYPHIYSFEDWKEALKWGENSMHYWSQDRGFWAPEGTVCTVFSDPLINRCDGQGFLNFYSSRDVYAFLDPGFGGDRCVLKFADVGTLEDGKTGIQLRPVVYIEPKVMNESERDYQIARTTIEECKQRGVKPIHFGSDATAIGRGVHAIISGEWSPEIHRVEWGGKASDKPSSQADGRPAVEIYANQVTELWFAVREFLEAGQLKGMDIQDIKEACSREYEQQGRRYLLNTKPECKKKLGYSPDCFVAGTLVKTISGLIPIEFIRDGDLVLTPFGYSPVILTHKVYSDKLTTVQFSGGQILCGKGNHEIFTWSGWTRLDSVSVDTEVESIIGSSVWQFLASLFTRVTPISFSQLVDTIKTETRTYRRDFFTELFGKSTTEIFLKVCSSIISTMIGETTKSKTWRSWKRESIQGIISGFTLVIHQTGRRISNTFKASMIWQSRGIAVQKAESGTEITDQMCGRTQRRYGRFATADRSLSAGSINLENTALSGVLKENESEEKRIGFVKLAAKAFLSVLARALKPVRVSAVTSLVVKPSEVYNLTLLHENAYYANGILVRNCMDAVAGLVEVVKRNGINAQGKIAELQSSSWGSVVKEAEKELALVEHEGISDGGGWADKDFGIDWKGEGSDR